jgi:hypothetical protein
MSARVEVPFPPKPAQPHGAHVAPPWVPIEPRWEYKEVTRDLETEGLLTQDDLNALGSEHWELAGLASHGTAVHFYFKRERVR